MEKAVSEFKKAIEARPLEPSPIYNLGIVYQKMGEMDSAIACMEKAIRTDPDLLSAYKVLSDLYRTKGLQAKEPGN